jgi:hypothetical protein
MLCSARVVGFSLLLRTAAVPMGEFVMSTKIFVNLPVKDLTFDHPLSPYRGLTDYG